MRAVTTATAAAVLRLERKAFDNLISRIGPEAIPPGRQGIERRIPVAILETLFLANELSTQLGVPARDAFVVAQRLAERPTEAADRAAATEPRRGVALALGPFVILAADLDALRAEMTARYEIAVETLVRPTRGRRSRRGTSSRAP